MPSSRATSSAFAGGVQALPQPRAPGVGQVRETRPESVGVGTDQRVLAGQVDVVAHDHQRAGPERRVEAAGGVRQDHDAGARAPGTAGPAGRRVPGGCPRTGGTGPGASRPACPPSVPSRSRPTWPGRGRGGPARQVRERDRDGVLEVVGEPAEAGPEDDPDLRHERRCTRGPRPRARPGGRLVRRAGWVGSGPGADRRRLAEAGQTCGPPGSRPGGRRPRPAASSARRKYRHRDADHVPPGANPRAEPW